MRGSATVKTAIRPNKLQALGERLQAALQAQTLLDPPIEIRCGFKQKSLLVLAQHPLVFSDVQQTFGFLEQTLQALPSGAIDGWNPAHPLPVRLYLRIVGQQQPYAFHGLTLEPKLAEPDSSAAEQPEAEPSGQIVHLPQAIAPLAADELAELDNWNPDHLPPQFGWFSRFPLGVVVAGAAVSVIAFTSTLYVLTRPCVLGACVPLQTAEQLSQAADQTIQTTTSGQAVVEAYDQLVEASFLLSTIPPWSEQYEAAQARIQTYEARAEGLAEIVTALRQAQVAAEKSQNPPHPFREWQEIQAIWQEAIARLEQVPTDSPVYALAQRKLTEYQANLGMIDQRVAIERDAQEKVRVARATARVAEAREGVAASVEGWQLTHGTWQTVVNSLQQVPQTTMAHAEAQQLLAIYQPKLAAARDRHTQEEISATTYNQAVSFAEQAQFLEQQNQWSEAVERWRSALTHAQQVPNNTLHHPQAQPLVNAYTAALAQAQEKLRINVAMQSAEADLDRTCAGTIRICDYSLGDNAIRVRITPDYDRAVEQAMTRTQMTGDYYTQAEVTAHVNTLLRAVAAISENAEMPIELYNADGSLFGTYEPELSGYVSRRSGE